MQKIILASASPRRSQLFQIAEIPFEVVLAPIEENFPEGLKAPDIAIHIATNKAWAAFEKASQVVANMNDYTIVAADTIVVVQDETNVPNKEIILGKPDNEDHAKWMLSQLSAKVHQVITGVCIISGERAHSFFEKTEVEFYPLTEAQMEHYITKYKPFDKAGAYAIQEWIGVVGIKEIRGDYYNVMGLPISRVVAALQGKY